MATIIQRESQSAPSGYDQGLLLEYKEALLYPLPSGLLDWQELRIGFRVSIYPNTGDWRTGNGWPLNMITPSLNKTSSAPPDLKIGKLFFGLKNSNNYLMPFESGDSRYIGLGYFSGDRGLALETNGNAITLSPRIVAYDSTDAAFYTHSCVVTSGSTLGTRPVGLRLSVSNTQNGGFCFPSVIDAATSGRHSQMFALRYLKVGNTGINFSLWKNFTNDNTSAAGTDYKTTTELRSFMNSMNSADTNKYSTFTNFFYRNSGVENGSDIPMPDAVFAYFSMTGHRLIIYDFIAEKI